MVRLSQHIKFNPELGEHLQGYRKTWGGSCADMDRLRVWSQVQRMVFNAREDFNQR